MLNQIQCGERNETNERQTFYAHRPIFGVKIRNETILRFSIVILLNSLAQYLYGYIWNVNKYFRRFWMFAFNGRSIQYSAENGSMTNRLNLRFSLINPAIFPRTHAIYVTRKDPLSFTFIWKYQYNVNSSLFGRNSPIYYIILYLQCF